MVRVTYLQEEITYSFLHYADFVMVVWTTVFEALFLCTRSESLLSESKPSVATYFFLYAALEKFSIILNKLIATQISLIATQSWYCMWFNNALL